MRRLLVYACLSFVITLAAAPAFAQNTGAPTGSPAFNQPVTDIDFVPEDAPHALCPAFGACPPGFQITTEYIGFGVDFTQQPGQPPVGVFNDPPDEWGGVNPAGDLDLLTDVFGRLVVVGTTSPGTTDVLAVTAGNVGAPDDILLEVFDASGALVGASIADDGFGPDGRHLAEVDLTGNPIIASFRVTTPTGDSYGVRHIYLNAPIGAAPSLPWPAAVALALLLLAAGTLVLRRGGARSYGYR